MSAGSNKRARLSPDPYSNNNNNNHHHPTLYPAAPPTFSTATSAPSSNANSSSSFRNVSACNRCRIRKNRCDQNLPACASCEKAGVKCVGFDPITKREIPRTYVYFLESRVNYLEELLSSNGIQYVPASSDFDLGSKPVTDHTGGFSPPVDGVQNHAVLQARARSNTETGSDAGSDWEQKEESDKLNKLVSNIGMVSVQGASDPRYLGSTSGISFARVVFAAIKSSVSDKNGGRASKPGSVSSAAATSGLSMRDSFFGLHSKPNMKPAPFPDRDLGSKLVHLYFEYANPQIPILHRGEFMNLFRRAYAAKDRQRSARELYMLNIVFAIGAGIILPDSSSKKRSDGSWRTSSVKEEPDSPPAKKLKPSSLERQPEEYHASAMMYLESFLASTPATDRPEGFGGGLEQLQAVLLLAGFALLRPVAPGLWYIIGVAVRLGVDLGLHFEDPPDESSPPERTDVDAQERGRKDWMRDLRRRLWWCVYSFDRLVSTCVGRPFGVSDHVVTTQWYSVLDDKDITPDGFLVSPHNYAGPSYKRVAHHYLRLRHLQSEILQVLQHRQAQKALQRNGPVNNLYMHTTLTCPFLQPFDHSFHAWRLDIDRRLWEWKESAPLKEDTTVKFNIKFLELNYWQAVIMLYRQSLSVPESFAGEKGPHTELESPLSPHADDHEDEEDIFLKVAEAGQRVLTLYRELHRVHLVNYTYLATVHLFMAGIAFLYSIWHSPTVRARLTLQDVDFTVLAGTSVLNDLIDKCPPAEACRDAFERMSKATIKMCQNTTGFGSQIKFSKERREQEDSSMASQVFDEKYPTPSFPRPSVSASRPAPTFDYNLKDLFSDQISVTSDGSTNHVHQWQAQQMQNNQAMGPQYPYPSPTPSSITSLPTSNPQRAQPPQFRDPSYTISSRSQQQTSQYDPRLLNNQASNNSNNAAQASSVSGAFDTSGTSNSAAAAAAAAAAATSSSYSSYASGAPGSNMATTPSSSTDLDFDFFLNNDNAPLPAAYNAGVGLNLGFDGRNDWATDGAGGSGIGAGAGGQPMPDLFGDFFFGGAGAMGQPGMNGLGGLAFPDGNTGQGLMGGLVAAAVDGSGAGGAVAAAGGGAGYQTGDEDGGWASGTG